MAKFMVSKIGQRLARFTKNNKNTDSETKEIEKNNKVMHLRDTPKPSIEKKQDDIWSDF